MRKLRIEYPQYDSEKHKGYGTLAHAAALKRYGVSPVYRRTYKPIMALLTKLVRKVDDIVVVSPPAPKLRGRRVWTRDEGEALKRLQAKQRNSWVRIRQEYDFHGKTQMQLKEHFGKLSHTHSDSNTAVITLRSPPRRIVMCIAIVMFCDALRNSGLQKHVNIHIYISIYTYIYIYPLRTKFMEATRFSNMTPFPPVTISS